MTETERTPILTFFLFRTLGNRRQGSVKSRSIARKVKISTEIYRTSADLGLSKCDCALLYGKTIHASIGKSENQQLSREETLSQAGLFVVGHFLLYVLRRNSSMTMTVCDHVRENIYSAVLNFAKVNEYSVFFKLKGEVVVEHDFSGVTQTSPYFFKAYYSGT